MHVLGLKERVCVVRGKEFGGGAGGEGGAELRQPFL